MTRPAIARILLRPEFVAEAAVIPLVQRAAAVAVLSLADRTSRTLSGRWDTVIRGPRLMRKAESHVIPKLLPDQGLRPGPTAASCYDQAIGTRFAAPKCCRLSDSSNTGVDAMKYAICGLLIASVVGLGCQKESSPGGPGAQRDDIQKESTNVFTLKVPKEAVMVQQGQEEKVAISINRGKTFDQTVKLKFDLPKGVEVTPGDAELKQGQTQREFSLKAMKDADVGEHAVKVTGTPESGPATTVSFTVRIAKAESSK